MTVAEDPAADRDDRDDRDGGDGGRIAAELRDRLQAGEPPPGEGELRTRYGPAGLPAARRALALLAAEGLAARRPGRPLIRRGSDGHQWEKARARQPAERRRRSGATEHATGLPTPELAFDISYRETAADADLALAFGVPPGTPLLERTYLTRRTHEPAALHLSRSRLVHAHVAGNPALLDPDREPWPGGTHSQLATVGIEIARIVERVTSARPPTAEEAGLLELAAGTAVIHLRKTCVDTRGRVVEVADITLPGEYTELVFTTDLAPW